MSISYEILGQPGRDNAVLLQVDSGQSVERLLFDCGEGCLTDIPISDIQAIDHLCFSHFHMDHVSGFDAFFRCNYARDTKPNHIWGPPGSAQVLQHRFQGFTWNLHEQMSASWRVTEIHPECVQTTRFELCEAFAVAHAEGSQLCQRVIFEGAGFVVEAFTMDHRTPTIAYLVREKPRLNIDTSRLASMGLRPGPWMRQLKDSVDSESTVEVDGVSYAVGRLREQLLVETQGASLAYLTDFLLDDLAIDRLSDALRGCQTMICESQYRHADLELARKNFHMTTVLSATLAQRAGADKLVLFHLSDRYDRSEWFDMLREAQQVFSATEFPDHWAPAR